MAIAWTDEECKEVEDGIARAWDAGALRDTILHWVDERMSDMLTAPRAWGSDEAIEMQVILLLQLRALTLRPSFDGGDPGSLVDAYMEYLSRTYPKHPHRPLHQIVEPDSLGFNIASELKKVIQTFTQSMLEENPFQHTRIELTPEHERRFLAVLGSSAPSEVYDKTEEIRGIDLDRGLVIVNRKTRLTCYVRPEHLQEVTEVGVQAHVQGTLYKPLVGRPFVIVSDIIPVSTEPSAS